MQKRGILFIGHDSTLTGAPILLMHLIRVIRDAGYPVTIFLMRGGRLEDQYRELGDCFVLKPENYHKNAGFIRKVFQYIKYKKTEDRLLKLATQRATIVFNNTIANGKFISLLKREGLPVLSYVHELSSVIKQNEASAGLTINNSEIILFPSIAVKQNLVSAFPGTGARFEYLPYYFPPMQVSEGARGGNLFPEGKMIIMGMGTATKRKGFDLFLDIAREMGKISSSFHFLWIGGFGDNSMKGFYEEFISTDRVLNFSITGELDHSPGMLKRGDIFLLTSREDPYPLVVIEAAQCSKPTIYFTGTGGIGEFVEDDAGWGIEPFAVKHVVELLLILKENPAELERKGEVAREKARRKHEDKKNILDRFSEILMKSGYDQKSN